MPDVHARLSASGSAKWLNCPGSVRLESEFPDRDTAASAEGTLAHSLGELKINFALGNITRNQYIRRCRQLARENGLDELPADMQEYTDSYRNFVIERYNKRKAIWGNAEIVVEEQLDYSAYVPGGFGTGDCIIISPGTIDIIDFKYGKGVLVPAENNSQLRLYALAALEEYNFICDVDVINYIIFQPRMDNVSEESTKAAELREWGQSEVKPRAALTLDENAECIAGEYCDSHFCKARAVCRAYNAQRLKLAEFDFEAPSKLSFEELSDILEIAPKINKWCELVSAYALEQAVHNGVKFPGFKLVEGRSNRVITDKDKVEQVLIARGYGEDEIIERSLIGLTKLERLIGKDELNSIIGKYIAKPAGKPCLVPETDKRPEIGSVSSAQADFENV